MAADMDGVFSAAVDGTLGPGDTRIAGMLVSLLPEWWGGHRPGSPSLTHREWAQAVWPARLAATGPEAVRGAGGTPRRRRSARCSRSGWRSGRGSARRSAGSRGRGSSASPLGTAWAVGRVIAESFGRRPGGTARSGTLVRARSRGGRLRRGSHAGRGLAGDHYRPDTSEGPPG